MTPRIVSFDGSPAAYRRRVTLLKDAQPDEPWSAEGERSADRGDAAAGISGESFFAEVDGDIVGFARCRAYPEDGSPARWRLWVAVAHGARRRGAGSALLAAAGEAAADEGAGEFLASTSLAEPDGLAFARARGFTEVEGEVELQLDLSSFRVADPSSRRRPPGLRLAALASLSAATPDWPERYHALYASLGAGVLWASPVPGPGLEHFRRFHLGAPGFLAEGTVVAVLEDHWVGLAELWRSGGNHHTAYQELTGVLPPYRGRGIATALVESLAGRAGALGFRRLLTSTGRGNRAMQAVASRLGFAATADWSYLLGPVPRVPSGQEVGA